MSGEQMATVLGEWNSASGLAMSLLSTVDLTPGLTIIAEMSGFPDPTTRLDYVVDFVGSIRGYTVGMDGSSVLGQTRYKPFGSLLGGDAVPSYSPGWVGAHGYRSNDLAFLEQYVWHRHYSTRTSQWTTRDMMWPQELAYVYVGGNPMIRIDPSGNVWQHILCGAACIAATGCGAGLWIACGQLFGQDEFTECIFDYWDSLPNHSKIGCVIGLVGCLGCIARYATKCKKPVCPPKVKDALTAAQKKACGVKMSCKGVRDCPTLTANAGKYIACISARLAVMLVCFSGGDARHWAELMRQIGHSGENLRLCIYKMKTHKPPCPPFK